jgi:hypothetical protein
MPEDRTGQIGGPRGQSPCLKSFSPRSRWEALFVRFCEHPRLVPRLMVGALLLTLPSLFIGFFMDDFVGRYVYSDLPGARDLFRILSGGFGVANGVPADTSWQIEHGHAPWWTYEHLRVAFFRPLAQATHRFDVRIWPNQAVAMHAHSVLWYVALVWVASRLYRGAHGMLVGGLAAFLFALDHTHGFSVGYIPNRHALISATFAALCLERFLHFRRQQQSAAGMQAFFCYGAALLASESSVAILGYLFAYLLFVERASLGRRALALAPYAVVTLLWRVAYQLAGYGAEGSGLYIDPAREPGRFISAFIERAPLLTMGQFFLLPAEAHALVKAEHAHLVFGVAIGCLLALCLALAPLLRANRVARFWAAGFAFSLVPASGTFAHNRQLLIASIGAMALLAQLWEFHVAERRVFNMTWPLRIAHALAALLLGIHVFASPLLLPLASTQIAFTQFLHRGLDTLGPELAGKDAVFVTVPEYFTLRVLQLSLRVAEQPLPRRWRALSFGPQRVSVRRVDERTLLVHYDCGILSTPFMELYRDRRLRMAPGQRVELEGLRIEVRDVTADGRAERVAFVFDEPLESPDFRFFHWTANGFAPFVPPALGTTRVLPRAPAWGQEEFEQLFGKQTGAY